jgi:hypothetical protein
MNSICVLGLALVLAQASSKGGAHDLTGTWTCHNLIADSTWTFGPKNRFVGEGKASHGGQTSLYHSDGTYILKDGMLHVHSINEWTVKGSSKNLLKPKDWDSKIAWQSSLMFKSEDGFTFTKLSSRPTSGKH